MSDVTDVWRRYYDKHVAQIARLQAALKELIEECDQSCELACVHSTDTVERARALLE